MIQLWIVFAFSVFLSSAIKPSYTYSVYSGSLVYANRPKYDKIFVFCVFFILALFSGLRSNHNDTAIYLYNFSNSIPESFFEILTFNWSIGENPGFFLYQVFIKQFISTNPYVFLLISSIIVIYLFVVSFYRYSPLFYLSIFLFIASGLFIFTMAAMKQVFAMAIGFWAIKFILDDKQLRFILFVCFASIIHPYILLYLVVPFFKLDVWSKKIILLLFGTVFIGFVFEYFVSFVVDVNSSIGNTYQLEYFKNKSGMNFFRVGVFAVVPILSFFFRKKINNYNNILLNISINMSVISLLFMIIGSYGAANMFGRLGNYFEPFTYIALPWIIRCFIPSRMRFLLLFFSVVFYGFYFFYQFVVVKPFEYKSWL